MTDKDPSTTTSKSSIPYSTVVYGGKMSAGKDVTGATKPYSLFVGGFNMELNSEDVKGIVSVETGLRITTVNSIHKNRHNQSFKIDIHPADKHKAFEADRWTEGLVVKPYRNQRTNHSPNNNRRNSYYNNSNTDNEPHTNHTLTRRDHNSKYNQYPDDPDRYHSNPDRYHNPDELYPTQRSTLDFNNTNRTNRHYNRYDILDY